MPHSVSPTPSEAATAVSDTRSAPVSHPMRSMSPDLTDRPAATHPHGFKSAIKGLFSPKPKRKLLEPVAPTAVPPPLAVSQPIEGVEVFSYSQKKTPVPAVPVDQADAPKYYFDPKDLAEAATIDSLPRSGIAVAPFSDAYRKHLSRRYSYTSLFTRASLPRKYKEPDLESFTFTMRANSGTVQTEEEASNGTLNRNNSDSDLVGVSAFRLSSYNSSSSEVAGDAATDSVLDDGFLSGEPMDVRDLFDTQTIHRLSMLEVVDPESVQKSAKSVVPATAVPNGHNNLLGTYSNIIEEISDLVPDEALVPQNFAQRRPIKTSENDLPVRTTGNDMPVTQRKSLQNLEDLIKTMSVFAQDTKDSIPSLSREVETDEKVPEAEQVVIEEYFVKHWVPDSPNSEQGSNGPNSVEGTEMSLASTHNGKTAVEKTSDSAVGDNSVEKDDEGFINLNGMQESGSLVVSRVTRVTTLAKDEVITGIELKVEPLGKVEADSSEQAADTIQSENLNATISGNSHLSAAPLTVGKRRSGLSQFLSFLMNH
ncbi:hypothetical protein HDU83_004236 [Entophlyctis luteolus]|nr:hypothetical protein HDU83_004236 [Entophlyctis luteolus]